MLLYLIVLFLVLPFVDFYLLFRIAGIVGFWETLGLVLATGIIGAWLVRNEGRFVLEKLQTSVTAGEVSRNFLEAFMLVLAGLMLISPGLITDGIGFLLVLRPLRERLVVWLTSRLKSSANVRVETVGF